MELIKIPLNYIATLRTECLPMGKEAVKCIEDRVTNALPRCYPNCICEMFKNSAVSLDIYPDVKQAFCQSKITHSANINFFVEILRLL